MALGLCLMWGYGGMLSFGQTFFFGISGYAYGVLAINMGGGTTTIAALVLSVVIAMIAAGILGYFMIWGGINGIFFGIVTLSATLVLAFFLGQTAGPEWHIGPARLNGFNGMKGMDPLADRRFLHRGIGALLCHGRPYRRGLHRAAHAGELAHRQRDRRDAREPAAGRDARLRRSQVSAPDVCHRQRARRPQRRALHVLGPIHHAVEHRPAGGRHADRVGGVLRAERPDRDAGRLVPAAVRFSDHHGLQPAGRARADGRASARHRDVGAAGLRAWGRQAGRGPDGPGVGGAVPAQVRRRPSRLPSEET